MINLKDLFKDIQSFLNLKKENNDNTINWYDSLDYNINLSESEKDEVNKRVKLRLLKSIKRKNSKIRNIVSYKWRAAAAVIVLFSITTLYWSRNSKLVEMSHDNLSMISPAKESAIIVLDDGKRINLDSLDNSDEIKVGNTIITKDGQGKVSYTYINTQVEQKKENTIYVPHGAIYQLTLSDGSHVILNSGSSLTYPVTFDKGDRTVKLDGEGYFSVKKNSSKSKFVVAVNNQKISVLGTQFNVKSYSSEAMTQTTLAEGSVRVLSYSYEVMLTPGQQALTRDKNMQVRNVELEDVLSWTNNKFCFDGTNTKEVLQDIARWYDIDIQYEVQSKSQYKGKIPRNLTLDKLIELLNYADLRSKAYIDKNNRVHLSIN